MVDTSRALWHSPVMSYDTWKCAAPVDEEPDLEACGHRVGTCEGECMAEEVEMGGFPAIESGADGFERVEVDSCDELTKAPKKKRAKKATTR
jgi:hypothetical protein